MATSRMTITASLLTTALLAPVGSATASPDWPQWGGPNRDNISESDWSPTAAAETTWSKVVGLGYSNVAIQDGRLFTVGFNEADEKDYLYCLNPETGHEIWSQSYPAKKWAKFHGGGSNCTPSIDGDKVYVFNRDGEFRCFDTATGKVHWTKNLVNDHDLELPQWGFAASPLVLDDMIIVNAGRVIAFSKSSGEVMWESDNYGEAYCTPVDFDLNGRSMLAVFAGYGLVVLDKEDGGEVSKLRWETKYDINPATPIVMDDKIFISSGYGHGCALVQLSDDGLNVVWENKAMRNHMTGSVLIGDHLYGFDEGILKCLDLNGEVAWSQRGLGKGALSGAGDKLIIVSSKGELIVAEATPEAYKEVSRSDVLDGGVYWTTPVLNDGQIYIRNSKGTLACRDHR